MRTTKQKLIISGSVLELYDYQSPVFYGSKKEKIIKVNKEKKKREKSEISPSSVYRAKANLRRLITTNGWAWQDENGRKYMPMFLTFTFKENITDLKTAHKKFTNFIQRFNYLVNENKEVNLKYVCVPEFQKRGAVHYHSIFFNLLKLSVPKLKKIKATWGQGSYRLEKITDIKKMIIYVAKYITKQMADERFFGQKKYFASKDLLKPVIVRDEVTIDEIMKFVPKESKTFENEWENEWTIKTTYQYFVLKEGISIDDFPLDNISKIVLRSASKQANNPRV